MKHIFIAVTFVAMFLSAYLSADPRMNKAHRGTTKGGVKINCVYCHQSTGAHIPKSKGQDLKKHYASEFCGGSGCHDAGGTVTKKR